ncbi:MAG: hypothetical protein ABI395_11435, partial [Sphingobium sp.]
VYRHAAPLPDRTFIRHAASSIGLSGPLHMATMVRRSGIIYAPADQEKLMPGLFSPRPLYARRWAQAALIAMLLPLAACGSKDTGNTSAVPMKDLDVVDGTVNDSMTDLDGVKSEGTALVDTGAGNASANATNAAVPIVKKADETDAKAEVVADQ